MFGVPQNLDLSRFQGAELIQVSIGCNELQLHFEPQSRITIERHWELRDHAGTVIDQAQDGNLSRESYKIHRILGQVVVEHAVTAPESFTLTFDNGMSITVFDDSDRYESFNIQPGDIHV
jgi:Family of unknown function (DUF6188)